MTQDDAAKAVSTYIPSVASILWVVFAFYVVYRFRRPVEDAVYMVGQRLRAGSSVKIWNFGLGQADVSRTLQGYRAPGIYEVRDDVDDTRNQHRRTVREESRRVFTVHVFTDGESCIVSRFIDFEMGDAAINSFEVTTPNAPLDSGESSVPSFPSSEAPPGY